MPVTDACRSARVTCGKGAAPINPPGLGRRNFLTSPAIWWNARSWISCADRQPDWESTVAITSRSSSQTGASEQLPDRDTAQDQRCPNLGSTRVVVVAVAAARRGPCWPNVPDGDYYVRAGIGLGEAHGRWLGATRGIRGQWGSGQRRPDGRVFRYQNRPGRGRGAGVEVPGVRLGGGTISAGRGQPDGVARRGSWRSGRRPYRRRGRGRSAGRRAWPRTRWRPRNAGTRPARRSNGAGVRDNVAGYDLTFSAPKSVSVR